MIFHRVKKLNDMKEPWKLIDTTFDKSKYIETANLENIQTINLVFSWWTMTVAIDHFGKCIVLELWYMQ